MGCMFSQSDATAASPPFFLLVMSSGREQCLAGITGSGSLLRVPDCVCFLCINIQEYALILGHFSMLVMVGCLRAVLTSLPAQWMCTLQPGNSSVGKLANSSNNFFSLLWTSSQPVCIQDRSEILLPCHHMILLDLQKF